jgi:hypothetical protein
MFSRIHGTPLTWLHGLARCVQRALQRRHSNGVSSTGLMRPWRCQSMLVGTGFSTVAQCLHCGVSCRGDTFGVWNWLVSRGRRNAFGGAGHGEESLYCSEIVSSDDRGRFDPALSPCSISSSNSSSESATYLLITGRFRGTLWERFSSDQE